MVFRSIEEAVEELKRHPAQPVRAHLPDLDVEMRALHPEARPRPLGDFLASLGPWEGEPAEALFARLREAREAGGSSEPPGL